METTMSDPVRKQKMIDEAKRMIQDIAQELKNDYGGKFKQVGADADERLKGIESEIMLVKIAVAAGGAPFRAPPGYSRSSAQSGFGINMKDAYGAPAGCPSVDWAHVCGSGGAPED